MATEQPVDRELQLLNLSSFHENNCIFAGEAPRPLPVVVITGFLGSGKTTLLRQVLSSRCNLRIAAVAHDLAPQVNVDAALLAQASEKAVRRANAADDDGAVVGLSGCTCCYNLDSELKSVVKTSLKQGVDEGRLDYLVLETSGAADPRKLVTLLEQTFGPCTRARLDRVVTVVDAELFGDEAGTSTDMEEYILAAQLACADLVVLNKVDLIDGAALSRSQQRLAELAPQARVLTCSYGKVPLPEVLEVSAASIDKAVTMSHEAVPTLWSVPQQMDAKPRPAAVTALPPVAAVRAASHHHVVEWSLEPGRLVSLLQWQNFLSVALPALSTHLRRGKGILHIAEDSRATWEWQMSGRLRYSCWRSAISLDTVAPASSMVLIFSPDTPQEELQAARSACEALSRQLPGPEALDPQQSSRVQEIIGAADDFEVLPPTAGQQANDGVIRFRLCGHKRFLIAPETDLTLPPYSVELDEMNRELALLVSSAHGGLFLGTAGAKDWRVKSSEAKGGKLPTGSQDVVALVWPVAADVALLERTVKVAQDLSASLLKRYFAHVTSCRCGY